MKEPTFDTTAAHKYFAAFCFNQSWKLLEQAERSREEDERLIALGHSSLWHWLSRADCADSNVAVAYWMLGRIYATVGRPKAALRYAKLCLELAEGARLSRFHLGCAPLVETFSQVDPSANI